jgi:negative regulator of flagellin synthesis FlgM
LSSFHKVNIVKIENNPKPVGPPQVSDTRPRPAKGPGAAAGASSDAQVTVSSIGDQLQKIEATLANVPVVDAARVQEIKNAISEGRFRVDAEKVADGLIESVRVMLAAQTNTA